MATAATKTFKNFIAGEWVDAGSGETFETTSPATGEVLGVFPRSSAEDVDRAVEAARAAYDDWRLTPAPKRGEILFRFGQLLAEHKDEVAELMAREMGKVHPRSRRRRPGSDRHELLHGRRGAAALRPDDAVASCATSST